MLGDIKRFIYAVILSFAQLALDNSNSYSSEALITT